MNKIIFIHSGRSLNRGDRIHGPDQQIAHVTGWDFPEQTLFAGWDGLMTSIPFDQLTLWGLKLNGEAK